MKQFLNTSSYFGILLSIVAYIIALSLKKKYKKAFKRCGIPINYIFENAATTWIGMMVYFGIIREGQIINPKEFVLLDFMTDDKLISIFELNRLSIIDYNNKIKKIN